MNYKLSFKIFTYGFLFIYLSLALIVISDPLQVFHKSIFKPEGYYKVTPERIAFYAPIRYTAYDSIILGTSMLQNSSANYASKKLKSKFINLSIAGGSFLERGILLKDILRKKPIKNVIYSLDGTTYFFQIKEQSTFPLSGFDFLYDDNLLNNMNVYLNSKFLSYLIEGFNPKIKNYTNNLDNPTRWIDEEGMRERFGGFDNWLANKENEQISQELNVIKGTFESFSNDYYIAQEKEVIDYIEKDIISIVKSNPKTNFHIIIPPYSKMYWKVQFIQRNNKLNLFKTAVTFLTQESSKYNNLKVYGFDNELFTKDIANYRDLTHYHPQINKLFTNAISDRTNILTTQNISDYFKNFETNVNDFNLRTYYDLIVQNR